VESNLSRQASNLVAVLSVHIRKNRVRALSSISLAPHLPTTISTYRRNLPRQINILGQAQLALLKWAFQIRLLDRVACIALLVDQGDEAVLDLQVHLRALTDFFFEVARRLDAQLLATILVLADITKQEDISLQCALLGNKTTTSDAERLVDARLGWVGVEVDLVNLQNVVCWVGAEVQRVVARHLEFLLHRYLVGHPRRRWKRRDADGAEARKEECGELHVESSGVYEAVDEKARRVCAGGSEGGKEWSVIAVDLVRLGRWLKGAQCGPCDIVIGHLRGLNY
jgi:hypothetical protein